MCGKKFSQNLNVLNLYFLGSAKQLFNLLRQLLASNYLLHLLLNSKEKRLFECLFPLVSKELRNKENSSEYT